MRNNKGFTLIELLVVVAIIGILAAIAIPQFALYRQRGFDARAESDLRNAATAEEAYFVDHSAYLTCDLGDGGACETSLVGYQGSAGVTGSMTAAVGSFTGNATHSQGTGSTFRWDSAAGGLQP